MTKITDMTSKREQAAFKRLAQCETSGHSWDTTKNEDYRRDHSLFMRDVCIAAHAVMRLRRELESLMK